MKSQSIIAANTRLSFPAEFDTFTAPKPAYRFDISLLS
jgi:hypothetical protein